MASRRCKYSADCFCYICGEFFSKSARKNSLETSVRAKEAYHAYFGMPVGDQDKYWAPHVICDFCRRTLEGWYRGEQRSMRFAVPRIWREPTNHVTDCYFCMTDPSKRRKGKNAPPIFYPDIPSSQAPVPHDPTLPIPKCPRNEADPLSSDGGDSNGDSDFDNSVQPRVRFPYYPNQDDLNDLIRDLGLTKSNGELLISRLKQWDLVHDSVRITSQRKRHSDFSNFFSFENGLCYCHDIHGLFHEMDIIMNTSDWRLFIDSSSSSLKAVLLHNTNIWPSIPLAHSVQMKEEYQNVRILLEALKYHEHQWELIGDFKMIGFLMGLQGGFTKYPCYLCLWDSRNTACHYVQKEWPARTAYEIGSLNVKNEALVDPSKVLLPPLHIKLGLIKQFVKQLDQQSEAFKYIENLFPRLSNAKISAGVFVGPQVKKLIDSNDFYEALSECQKVAWRCFISIVRGFLGNHRADHHEDMINELLVAYKNMGCRMSLKLHVLHSHLDKFKENMGHYSEEQGERFHQDVSAFEERYKGHCNQSMMGDYIWNLLRDSDLSYNRQPRKKISFRA